MNTGDGGCVSELAALRLCGFSDPWRWQRSGDERRRRRMSRRACGSAAWRLGGLLLRLCGFAALRLCGLRVPWQLCGFAALRLCGLRVPWRLCGFAALRLCGLSVPWRLCGFAALTLFRVRACTRTRVQWFLSAFFFVSGLSFLQVLSCSFDSSHSFATSP